MGAWPFTSGFCSSCSKYLWTFSSISKLAERDLDDRDFGLDSEDSVIGSDDDLDLPRGDVGVLGEMLDFELDLLTRSLPALLMATWFSLASSACKGGGGALLAGFGVVCVVKLAN